MDSNPESLQDLSNGLAWFALALCLAGLLISASLWAIGSKGQNPGQELTGKKGFIVCITAAFFIGALPGLMNFLSAQADGVAVEAKSKTLPPPARVPILPTVTQAPVKAETVMQTNPQLVAEVQAQTQGQTQPEGQLEPKERREGLVNPNPVAERLRQPIIEISPENEVILVPGTEPVPDAVEDPNIQIDITPILDQPKANEVGLGSLNMPMMPTLPVPGRPSPVIPGFGTKFFGQ